MFQTLCARNISSLPQSYEIDILSSPFYRWGGWTHIVFKLFSQWTGHVLWRGCTPCRVLSNAMCPSAPQRSTYDGLKNPPNLHSLEVKVPPKTSANSQELKFHHILSLHGLHCKATASSLDCLENEEDRRGAYITNFPANNLKTLIKDWCLLYDSISL